ncbi:YitT family protein [Aquimarina algicola]|uniref:YitT family protein n=1 Tax=Aquimarina algicola TaxID=2589995 RepID=A0A504JQR9_9FLAO|nr:YitT family protein [Aquimarina algicola]TPN88690.1 YitT family protein [Aquimarina algicola]
MNSIWKRRVIQAFFAYKQRKAKNIPKGNSKRFSENLKIDFISWVKDVLLIALGVIAAAFGLESFLLPNNFIDGGVTGISLLISELTTIPLYILILAINIPFIFLGFRVIGKRFAIRAIIAISGLAFVLAFFNFPEVTQDKLLVSVFGGFFLGAGIGLSVRGGSVLDGTEVLAIFMSKKLSTTVGDAITIINIIIFSAAAYFLSIETALYSMLTYLAASKTLDFVIEGIEEYTGVTIISEHNQKIMNMVAHKMRRGITIYKGRQGYMDYKNLTDIDILYTVVTRLEISKLNTEIEKIDPNAFVIMHSINDTRGGMIKKKTEHIDKVEERNSMKNYFK